MSQKKRLLYGQHETHRPSPALSTSGVSSAPLIWGDKGHFPLEKALFSCLPGLDNTASLTRPGEDWTGKAEASGGCWE